jgi:hypothetical protein
MVVAARNCFWNFSNTVCRAIGSYLELSEQLRAKTTLFQTLSIVVGHVLKLDGERLLEVTVGKAL